MRIALPTELGRNLFRPSAPLGTFPPISATVIEAARPRSVRSKMPFLSVRRRLHAIATVLTHRASAGAGDTLIFQMEIIKIKGDKVR